jgi:hypothetical protein
MEHQTQEQAIVQTPAESPVVTSTLLSPIALLKQAWGLYKNNIWKFAGIMAIPMVLAFILTLLAGGGFLVLLFFIWKMKLLGLALLLVAGLVGAILFTLLFLWSHVALIVAVRDREERIGVLEAYKRSRHLISSYFTTNLIVGLVVIGGFMLFVVPGVIFAVWLSLVSFVFVCENLKGMDALVRSREYVRGKWGAVLGRIVSVAIVYFVAGFVLDIIMSVVKVPTLLSRPLQSFIMSILVAPFMTIYMYFLYMNLRVSNPPVSSEAEKPKKTLFIVFAWIGGLLIPLMIFGAVALFSLFLAKTQTQGAPQFQVVPVK